MGLYVIFETDVGGDINYEYPLTHLDIFNGTELHLSSVDINLGDAFVVLWLFYLSIFVIATLGPKLGFLKTMSSVISLGKYDVGANYMIGVTKWFSILVLVSALINFVQEGFGVEIIPPPVDNDLIQFFYVSLAPLMEEFVFRIILIGLPLFALHSNKSSVRYLFKCLWNPSFLNIHDMKKAIFIVVFVGILFGFSHIAFADSWSGGKFAQAAAGGIILGWVYLRYGFAASLLIHWATNYFVFSYATFLSQINEISIHDAFSHSLMSSLELLFLASGILSICILLIQKFFSAKEKSLKI